MSRFPSPNAARAAAQCLRLPGVPGAGRWSSIAEVAAAFDRGASPVTIVDACLRRMEARNGTLKAMIAIDAEGARAAARAAEGELRAGRRRGPLHGVPLVVKDVISVAGWPTTGGSRLLDGQPAGQDAACVTRLKAAGAIILGKTNLHELTVGGHDNPWFGKVVNPLDDSRGTGGSSSGSAAAVAAGFCVAAIGTDTGGSNRSPAAATGLVGFKPSRGLVDATGSLPTARSLDTIGAFTTTVQDSRLVAQVLSGVDPGAGRVRPLPGLVVGTCPGLYAAAVDPVVARSHAVWLETLQRAGVRVVELPFDDAAALRDAGSTILKYEFAEHYGGLIGDRPDRVGDGARAFAAAALAVTPAAYESALSRRVEIRNRFFARLVGVDVVAIPTVPGLAPRLSDESTRVGDALVAYGAAGASFRLWANCLDMPALALPLPCDDALPASIQIAALPGQDWALFDIAEALTAAAA